MFTCLDWKYPFHALSMLDFLPVSTTQTLSFISMTLIEY
jgi:hypothetical protein